MTNISNSRSTPAGTCSLSPDSLNGRVNEWRSLAARALRRQIEPGRIVTVYPNEPEVAQGLVRLVAAEKECCSFLKFSIREQGSELTVELDYPPKFAATLSRVLSGAL